MKLKMTIILIKSFYCKILFHLWWQWFIKDLVSLIPTCWFNSLCSHMIGNCNIWGTYISKYPKSLWQMHSFKFWFKMESKPYLLSYITYISYQQISLPLNPYWETQTNVIRSHCVRFQSILSKNYENFCLIIIIKSISSKYFFIMRVFVILIHKKIFICMSS